MILQVKCDERDEVRIRVFGSIKELMIEISRKAKFTVMIKDYIRQATVRKEERDRVRIIGMTERNERNEKGKRTATHLP